MKKILFLTCMICFFNLAALAQNTNFSGTWELDTGKSKMDDKARVESMTMSVTHTENEIKIETTTKRAGALKPFGAQTRKYSLDGKETTVEFNGVGARGTTTHKAEWETAAKLSLTSTSALDGTLPPAASMYSATAGSDRPSRAIRCVMGSRLSSAKVSASGSATVGSTSR